MERISETKTKLIRSLSDRKGRERTGDFFAEGSQIVNAALTFRRFPLRFVLVSDKAKPQAFEAAQNAEFAGIPVFSSDDRLYSELSETVSPDGVMAVFHRDNEAETALFEKILKRQKCMIIWLEGIQDPGNTGSIIRSAEALGADGIVLAKGSADLTNPKTVRGSMGAILWIPCVTEEEFGGSIASFADMGFTTCATTLDRSSKSLYKFKSPHKILLCFGN
jgi:TrmH family RNA methyltransferase